MTAIFRGGMLTFRVPRTILENDNLKVLSGDAIRLFLFISHRCYRERAAQLRTTNFELNLKLGMSSDEVTEAYRELRGERIMDVSRDGHIMVFHLLNADGTRAKSYLREQLLEPVPNQD